MSRPISNISQVIELNADTINPPTLKLGAFNHSMHQSNPSNPSSSRPTLTLKLGARKSPREAKTPAPRPQSKLSQKPGAAWSDDLKNFS
jgi:hypothetical protein